jgi:hypothetical protein
MHGPMNVKQKNGLNSMQCDKSNLTTFLGLFVPATNNQK